MVKTNFWYALPSPPNPPAFRFQKQQLNVSSFLVQNLEIILFPLPSLPFHTANLWENMVNSIFKIHSTFHPLWRAAPRKRWQRTPRARTRSPQAQQSRLPCVRATASSVLPVSTLCSSCQVNPAKTKQILSLHYQNPSILSQMCEENASLSLFSASSHKDREPTYFQLI